MVLESETAPPCVRLSLPSRSRASRSARAVTVETPSVRARSATCTDEAWSKRLRIAARRSSAKARALIARFRKLELEKRGSFELSPPICRTLGGCRMSIQRAPIARRVFARFAYLRFYEIRCARCRGSYRSSPFFLRSRPQISRPIVQNWAFFDFEFQIMQPSQRCDEFVSNTFF